MKVLIWLLLLYLAIPGEGAKRFFRTPPPRHGDQLSKKEIVKALSELLAGTDDTRDIFKEDEKKRSGRQFKENEKKRTARQFPGFANPLGECEVVGYETKVREECEEVSNIECKKINVTMYRPEIRQRCKTSFDQTCNVTYKDVPTDKCSPTERNR